MYLEKCLWSAQTTVIDLPNKTILNWSLLEVFTSKKLYRKYIDFDIFEWDFVSLILSNAVIHFSECSTFPIYF